MSRNTLSDDEFAAVLAAELGVIRADSKFWFWVRTGYILCYTAAIAGCVAFFPERVLSKFHLPPDVAQSMAENFIVFRVTTGCALMAGYIVSYLRGWLFPYVAFGALLVSIGNLVNDVFTLYVYVTQDALMTIEAILMLRVLIILSFLLNFLSARDRTG